MNRIARSILTVVPAMVWALGGGVWGPPLWAQQGVLSVPAVAAHAKGPDQINLTWPPVAEPGYGYLVEIQSAGDNRYATWTEMEPVPRAGGFLCDSRVEARGARCKLGDPTGEHVYNPAGHGVPYWVTEPQYSDPQDGTPAQFIAWGLKPGTAYSFRARTYRGNKTTEYGGYSNIVAATTPAYGARYVSPRGDDANDGKAPDTAHAWRTLRHGTSTLACGQVLMVLGGDYGPDEVRLAQKCTAEAKAVVLVNPGETAALKTQPPGSGHAVVLAGDHLVIDGLRVVSPGTPAGEYDAEISGSHNALLNVEFRPEVIPSFKFGVAILGPDNLVYRSYLHDYGSPDSTQNPDGSGGFVLALMGASAEQNAIWSNHLTRGGHDQSLCKSGCRFNRWMNNVMDGGWGQGWAGTGTSDHNLVEGNLIWDVGQVAAYYKPAIQVSGASTTVRRNVVAGTRTWALEVSSFGGWTASHNLIYNNVFYNSGGCYFQSSHNGPQAYSNVVFANNICYKILRDPAFQIYLGTPTGRNVNNVILAEDPAGSPRPRRALIVWNAMGGAAFETGRPLEAADRSFAPVFSRNQALAVPPRFVDEAGLDFHLSTENPLVEAGLAITNTDWGSTAGAVEVGAYGIQRTREEKLPADDPMQRARAGSYAAAANAVAAGSRRPNALALEAALRRAAFDDTAAAKALARIGTSAPGDLMGRYERVRQGTPDAALWDLLAANPERLLEMADAYIQWGLERDALGLVAHKFPQPVPALNNALVLYYRSYCRDVLDYAYYAGEDRRVAGTLPLAGLVPRFAGAERVLGLVVQRNPTDANAYYLLALARQAAGNTVDAGEAARSAVQLRAGFPEAEALVAKLGPQVERKKRAAAPDPAAANGTPAEIAGAALRVAASGDAAGALGYFTAARFPGARQEDVVRDAYLELRLRRLVDLAAAKQCAAAAQGLGSLEAPDPSLPFTAQAIGALAKSVRLQYWLGMVEFACVDQSAARTRWEKLTKASPEISSADYAYTFLALWRLNPAEGVTQARKALGFLERQMGKALPEHQGKLLHSEGVLQAILGKKQEAAASFRAGAEAGPAGMIEYLNLDAIRWIEGMP